MIEKQLVDYVKSQFQGGAARETLKAALVGTGWPEADVEDTIKSVEPSIKSAEPSMFSKTAPAIMVSDLLANPDLGVVPNEAKKGTETGSVAAARNPGKIPVVALVLGVVAVLFAAASVYLYFENNGLKDKVAASSAAADAANAKVAGLDSQVENLNKQVADLSSKNAALSGDNQKFLTELSFFFVPANSTEQDIAFTFKGNVSSSKSLYTITADDGFKITIKNSKDVKVDAALKSLLGQTAEVSGIHAAGLREVTVTAVNGLSTVTPPAPAPQASTSTPAASTSTPNATSSLP